jgi:hypothetical protein
MWIVLRSPSCSGSDAASAVAAIGVMATNGTSGRRRTRTADLIGVNDAL